MSTPPTRFILLGRVAIEQGGDPAAAVVLSGRRPQTVFAYLAVERGRSVSRDELADALWPDLLPDTWNAALRGVLSDVRRFLGRAGLDPAEVLETEQGRLRLRLPPGAALDVEEARDDLIRARSELAAGATTGAAMRAERAADAAALPFLSLHDEGWAAAVRTELDRIHIDALEVAAAAHEQVGDLRAALAAVDRLVRADPFLEAAHRRRITVLGALGDRAGAAKAYERCATLLTTELGITPSAATDAALRRALDGAPASADRPSPPAVVIGTAAIPAAPAAPAGPSRFGDRSVLVVEDHDFQRRTTLTLLQGLGVGELQDAADGASALAILDTPDPPDVIICDIDMPGMDGVEFIRHVAERRPASAVIIASGLDGRVLDAVRAASEGYGLQVLGAVRKPLTATALGQLLDTYGAPLATAATPATTTPAAALDELATALAAGTIGAEFEPIVDLGMGSVAGFRAAAPGPLPDGFLAAVDGAGLGRPLVEHLLRRASAPARELNLGAFVELSPALLTDLDLADALAAITRDRVVLVIAAEALAAERSPALLDVLARLRVKGFGLCLEGFDPDALGRFPLTHVQLPAELVAAAAAAGDALPLQAAVAATRDLGIPLVGHCATATEFDLLLQVGCSFAHGPFLAGAVAPEDLSAVARHWMAPSAAGDLAR